MNIMNNENIGREQMKRNEIYKGISKHIVPILVWAICYVLVSSNSAYSEENILKYKIRNETFKKNGILVSQPKVFDKKIVFTLATNNIQTIEDYSEWLKRNFQYKKDTTGDIWADPYETLIKKQGDCEDFTFLTQEVLKGLGYKPRFFALVNKDEAHAICVFKKDGYYMWFDNATLKKTHARNLKEFTKSMIHQYDYIQLSELDTQTNNWHTIYSNHRRINNT